MPSGHEHEVVNRVLDIKHKVAGFLSVPAFAQHLNVTDMQVRNWIRAGVLPGYRFVTEWRIAKTDTLTD